MPALRVMPMPADANAHGDVFGGWIMAQVDIAGSLPAARRANGRVATVAVNSFVFKQRGLCRRPAVLLCQYRQVGKTSVTVNVEVYSERSRLQIGSRQGHRSHADLCRHRRGPQAAPAAARIGVARLAHAADGCASAGFSCSGQPASRHSAQARHCCRRPRIAGSSWYPFRLGVASGSPLPDAVVLWTRILPDPLRCRMRRRRGRSAGALGSRRRRALSATSSPAASASALPELAHSVHVDVTRAAAGPLVLVPLHAGRRGQPDRPHPHRAGARRRCRGSLRLRTPPASTGSSATTRRTATSPRPRPTWSPSWATTSTNGARTAATHPPRARRADESMTLADYRARYAQYKADPRPAGARIMRRPGSSPGTTTRCRTTTRTAATAHARPGLRAAPGGRLPGVLRAHAAAAAGLPHGPGVMRTCASTSATTGDGWRGSTCWTTASTARTRRARSPARGGCTSVDAALRGTPAARAHAAGRGTGEPGWRRGWPRRRRAGTSWPSRR